MRLIDADELKELFATKCASECDNCNYCKKYKGTWFPWYCGLIDEAPTVFTQEDIDNVLELSYISGQQHPERPKGKWIGDTDYESFQGSYEAYKCSICGHSLHWRDYCSNKYNFCPNCGARMER